MVGEEGKKGGEFRPCDEQILQSMTPDQLEELTKRATSRKRKKIESGAVRSGQRVRRTPGEDVGRGHGGSARNAVSTVPLDRDAKKWMFERGKRWGPSDPPLQRRTGRAYPRPSSWRRSAVSIQHADEVTFE
jgi:hypothetical protein